MKFLNENTESIIKDWQAMEVMWTDKDNSEKKKIRELEKEAAYERLHSYSTKKYQVHDGLVTDVKKLN